MNRKDRRAEEARQRHAKATVGMELRYGGRTLVVTAYVNTDEEPQAVYQRVEPAARGPKHYMALVTVAVFSTGQALPIWESQGIPTFFGGRTLVLTCYVNTDESLDHDLTRRVMNAANKPSNPNTHEACGGQLAVTVTGGESPLEEAREMWSHVIRKLKEQKNGPN
jgi:hypothetical protein